MERNTLMAKCYPRIKDYCREKHGLEFQRVPKLQAEDQAVWWDTLNKMQKLLRKAAASLGASGKMDKECVHNYFMSAYVRYINNINLQNLKKASLFVDIINRSLDTESAKLLGDLRDVRLPNKIESSNMQKYTVEWIGREGLDIERMRSIYHFISHFYNIVQVGGSCNAQRRLQCTGADSD
ncbi:unnamed protein product [Ceratitis capitata]|uniref:(Mediterranean fruit fly) hypothetical protein n=1 Tax=Ceratitis capitata TaxID=7213 RepID=A0A811U9D9_CERCA|nr:unnamed protein product [Ceratitis capitata]